MKQFFQNIGKVEVRNIIAVLAVVGTYILLYMMIIKPIPAENKETLNISIGFVFGGLVGGISGFLYGASKQRNAKTENEI